MSDNFFPFAVQHIKATYTYLDDIITSDSFSSGAVNVSFSHTANSVSTIKAFYGTGTSVSPLSLIASENYVETTSELTFHEPAAKAGKVQYHYNAYTQITETIDVTGLNLTLSHPPVTGYPITITSEDDETTYINGTDYNINALNSRIIELIPGGNIVQRTNTNYYYTMNGDGSSQFGTGGGGGGVAAVPDTYYDENDLPESIFVEYDTVTPVEDETGNATTVEEITSYTVSAFASGIDFRLVSVDELIVDGRTLAINEFSFNEKTGVVTLHETPTSLAIQISYTWRRHYGLMSLSLDSAGTGNLTVPASLVSIIKYPIVKTLETGGDTLLQYQDYVIEENLSSGIHKLVLLTDAIDGQVVVSEDGAAVYQTPVKLINQDNFNYDKLEDHHIVYRDGQLAISEEDPSRYVEYRDYDNEEYNSEWVERLTGSGTLGDPYLIYTPYDFLIKAHDLDKMDTHFKLMNNLDFEPVLGYKISTVNNDIIAEENDTTAPYFSQYGSRPIWYDSGECRIYFDGNNKIIKNIYSWSTENDNWGLAGSIFNTDKVGGVVQNLTIYNSYKHIEGNGTLGFIFNFSRSEGLIVNNVHIVQCKIGKTGTGGDWNSRIGAIGGAHNSNLQLINCSVLDSVIETGQYRAAALVGSHDGNYATISLINCYSNSIVKTINTDVIADSVNGLYSARDNEALANCNFENCYFAGQILCNSNSDSDSGWPIFGRNGSITEFDSILKNCYSKSGSGKVQPYVTVKSEAEMKQPLFVNLLNTGLGEPAYVYNPGGYPKLLEEKIHPLSSNYRIPVLDSNGAVLYSTPYKLADLEKIPSISLAWKNYIEEELADAFNSHSLTYYTKNTLPESIFIEYDALTPVEDETGNATTVGEITSYQVSTFATGIGFRLVSVDELIVDSRTLAINEFSFDEKTGVVTLSNTPESLSIQISYTWKRHYGTNTVAINSTTGVGNLTVPVNSTSIIKFPIVKTLETGGDTLLQYQDYIVDDNLTAGTHNLVLLTNAIDGQVVGLENGIAVYQTPVKLINQDNFNYDKLEDHHIVYRDGQLAISEEDPSRYVEYRDYDNEEYNSEWVERLTGSGTLGDPYLIYTPYDFLIKAHDLEKWNTHFKLMNNLDFGPVLGYKISTVNGEIIAEENDTTAPYFSSVGSLPIWYWSGDCKIYFDGNNKIIKNMYSWRGNDAEKLAGSIFNTDPVAGVIKNLTIYNSYKCAERDAPLGFIFNLSRVNEGLRVENVHIVHCRICKTGINGGWDSSIGAIGGAHNSNLQLINCSVLDSVIETGAMRAATLVGGPDGNYSTISLINCYSNSIVKSINTDMITDSVNGLYSAADNEAMADCHFENCYFAGQILGNTSNSNSGWPIFGRRNGSMTEFDSILDNCYSKSGSGKVQPYVTVKSEAEMKQPLFVNLLNAELEEPAYVYNPGGYPKLLDEKIHPLSNNFRIPVLDSNGAVLYSTPYKMADLEKIPSISLAWKNYIEEKLDNVSSPHALTYYTEASLPQMIHTIVDWTESVTNETGTLDQDGLNYILAASSILPTWSPIVHDVHNVSIDNVELDSSQWSFDATTKTITLDEAKPNAAISVSYSVDIHMDKNNISIVQSGDDIGIGYIGYVSYPTNGTIVRSYSSVVVKDLNTDDQLVEKQDYIINYSYDYPAGFGVRLLLDTPYAGQIAVVSENNSSSVWLKPSLTISNPDNIEDLNNHPVVYKDGNLQYGSLPTATDTNLGLVQVGSNISVSNGEISVSDATSSTKGVVSVGSNINVSNGKISVPAATASTKGVVAYDSNLFKTNTNDKLSLNTLIYKRSYRGVTASLPSNDTETVTIDFTNPNGYKLLTTEVKTNSSLCCYSWTQTAMVQNYSSGSVQVSFRNLDNGSLHAFNYLIDLIFVKTNLIYHEYNDTRSQL